MMYILVLVHLMWTHWSMCGADETECGQIRCYNNGTAARLDERCVCSCTLGYAGILCEYKMLASRWPSGPYALMKPTSGCPESEMHGWRSGSIQFSTLDQMAIWRESTVNDERQRDLLMKSDTVLAGQFGNYTFQLNFCFKRADWLTHDGVSWLPGDSVIGVAEGCPRGMAEETQTWVLPKLRFWRSDGNLPYLEVQNKAKDSSFVLKRCRYIGTPSETIIQRHKPFISAKKYEHQCHSAMEGFTVTEETLLFHDAGVDVDAGQATAAKLSFCVYSPEEKQLLKDSAWPNGPYALLMHNGGCPESQDRGWSQGYISFETRDPVMRQYYVTEPGDTEVPGNNTFRIYFCYKYGQQQGHGYETKWPPGAHGVLSADQGCPQVLALTMCQRYDVFSGITAAWKLPFILMKSRIAANQCSLKHDDFSVADETITIATTQSDGAEQAFSVSLSACVYETREDFGCADDEFRCDNGKCVMREAICPHDDFPYCEDRSNLKLDRCPERCYENEFFCDMRRCIPRQWLCDGFAQCESGTDELEANCNFTAETGCFERELRCGSGACVPPEWVCDGVKDCEDASDEILENCDGACPLEVGSCIDMSGRRKCVTRGRVCSDNDDSDNCVDGRDKDPAVCHLGCQSDEVYVGPGGEEMCLWKEEHCNDYSDCSNIGVQQRWDCGKDEFACDVDRCVREEDICDGTAHCQDHADENCDMFVSSTASCKHDLGLASGFIQDDQISATSSPAGHSSAAVRPSLASWCPTPQDENPYLQFDLRSVSVVSGLTLYNWVLTKERIEHNIFVQELVPLGCRAFSVSHAVATHSFIRYSDQNFEIDTSEATAIPQNFTFLRPFLARYVRIHPVEAIGDGRLCLRLELRGCLGTDTFLDGATNKRVDETLTDVLEYEIITSPNFPAPYPDNSVYKWIVTAINGGFVRMTFALIDLYDKMSLLIDDCPGDRLEFDADAFGPVTAKLNGLTPTFPTDQTIVVITFTTCDRLNRDGDDRKGFRVILKNEAVPTIWSQIKETRLQDGHVITQSLLGIIYNLPSKQTWELRTVMNGGPFTLTFWYFNVPCKLGFEFKMGPPLYIGRNMVTYCNTEIMPAKEVTSWWINLELDYTKELTIHEPEGFRASFRVNPVARDHHEIISNETISPPRSPDDTGFHQVCSDVLKKCYRYSYRHTVHDWTTQARYCRQLGYNLPVIHSQRELHFLQSWLVERIYEFYASGQRRYYMHVLPEGLTRGSQTDRTELWQDGTEVTFTAWGPGEPRDFYTNLCTWMVIDMATYESRWETRACGDTIEFNTAAFVSLCETPYYHLETGPVSPQSSNASSPPIQEPRLFQCNSSEWLFFLAVCDGVPDCGDGSDELGCGPATVSGLKELDRCLDNEFQCANGECVHIGLVCDFSNDCGDNSDEYCVYPGCREGEFRCTNGDCVPHYVTCDAVIDCRDGSDETDCKTCNSSTAFSCGELTCIHVSQVCDGVADCTGSVDEQGCDEKKAYPCNDYWMTGYDKDITFDNDLRGMNVTCHFERTAPGIVRSTTYFQLQPYQRSAIATYYIDFSMNNYGGLCTMEITETCPTYTEEVAAFDDPYYNGTYSFCSPRTITLFLNYNTWWECHNVTESRSNPGGVRLFMMSWFFCADFRIVRPFDDSNVTAVLNVTVNPAVCVADYKYEGMHCGDGTKAQSDRRCLFETNSAGAVDGCRNFFHLQDCEVFECPADYMKCPSTFCVPVRSICDGVIQCPGGEDEWGCRCSSGKLSILAVFDDDADRNILNNVHEFARNFRSPEVIVYSVNLKVTSGGITVKMRAIHPYNDALNIDPEKEFTSDNDALASIIVNRTAPKETLHVVTLAQNQQQRAFLTDQFLLPPAVAHIYHVGIAPMTQQHVTVVQSGMRTDVTFDSWFRFGRSGDVLFPEVCENRTLSHCQDRFRCSSSLVCLPWEQVCDGVRHCRHGDDEAMCDFRCLETCTCQQYVADCQHSALTELDMADLSTTTRILDISFTDIYMFGNLSIPKPMPYLVRLFAKQCGVVSIEQHTFVNTPNLYHLDLSFNRIQVIGRYAFSGLRSLRTLQLNGNTQLARIEPYAFMIMFGIQELSITQTRMVEVLPNTFAGLDLKLLDISNNKIQKLYAYAFNNMSAIEIKFEGNDIQDIESETFAGVLRLEKIRAPSYAFCCYKPNAIPEDNCWPKKDEFSSCEDLMRNSVLQTLLWVIGASAIIGNVCTIGCRMIYKKKLLNRGYGMFVTNLAAADGFMGIYLLIIAVADILYRDRYMVMDVSWRNSGWCTFAGTLATVASEASVFLMCLITLDRILVIKYPFGQFRFEKNSSRISVAVSWLLAIVIAVVPFCFPGYFEGQFYSTSGVCLSLPLTRRRPSGWAYSFVIYVVLNFVAFLLIAIGQLVIYLEIRKTSQLMKGVRSHRSNDIAVTRSLLLILSTDFLCWFPIGVMAIMAYNGHVISGDVYAWTVVLVLPINSALNPYMYTLSAVVGRKKSVVEKAKYNFLLARNQAVGVGTPRYQTMLTFEPRQDGVFTPRDALSASLAVIGCIRAMHYSGLIYGHIRVDTLKDGKIRMSLPTPSKPKTSDDKATDIGDFGNAVQDLLKAMKI